MGNYTSALLLLARLMLACLYMISGVPKLGNGANLLI